MNDVVLSTILLVLEIAIIFAFGASLIWLVKLSSNKPLRQRIKTQLSRLFNSSIGAYAKRIRKQWVIVISVIASIFVLIGLFSFASRSSFKSITIYNEGTTTKITNPSYVSFDASSGFLHIDIRSQNDGKYHRGLSDHSTTIIYKKKGLFSKKYVIKRIGDSYYLNGNKYKYCQTIVNIIMNLE
jgi:hypothetical protein